MTPQPNDPHSQSSGLGWPLAAIAIAVLAAITVITVTGHDPESLSKSLGTLLSVVGAGGGIGAWINSTRAAKQTNGVLDKRMDEAVQRGLGKALTQAKSNRDAAAAAPAMRTRGKARPVGEDTAVLKKPTRPHGL